MSYDKRSASGRVPSSAASVRSDKKDRKNGHLSVPIHGSNGHLRVPSQSYEDSGSEVYVTSGAYRAPSEIRSLKIFTTKKISINV